MISTALTDMFTTTEDDDRAGVERWFQRNLHLAPNSARQYAALYMLLLEADPSKQEASTSTQPAKQTKQAKPSSVANGQTRTPKQRAAATTAQPQLMLVPEPAAAAVASEGEHSAQVKAPRTHHARGGFEPTLNINVQIHTPSDATPDQIEKIFKSMARHLYQRQDEASE